METYIQQMKDDPELGPVPFKDFYFLGCLSMRKGVVDYSLLRSGLGHLPIEHSLLSRLKSHYTPQAFTNELFLRIDPLRYTFEFLRREFVGEVRCLVVDIRPRSYAGKRRFIGRVWIEDRDYNIVRFQGTYLPSIKEEVTHFDCWRINSGGAWLPSLIYAQEEPDSSLLGRRPVIKAQTRLWNYKRPGEGADEAFSVMASKPNQSGQSGDQDAYDQPEHSLLVLHRNSERKSAENVIERLQRVGLIAPRGETEQVLETVLDNLIFSANLRLDFRVEVRILLTAPLESATVNHTILLSRGLIDVLPDEAALAAVLAHELAHIVLGHRRDTKFASENSLRFEDLEIIRRVQLGRDPDDEKAADYRAIDILRKSPYAAGLPAVGLLLRLLASDSNNLQRLLLPLFGNGMSNAGKYLRLSMLMNQAPELQPGNEDQIAALSLGSRIFVDPWSDRVQLLRTALPQRLTSRDKLELQITPFMMHLVREERNMQSIEAIHSRAADTTVVKGLSAAGVR
jgi:hypothetical protein